MKTEKLTDLERDKLMHLAEGINDLFVWHHDEYCKSMVFMNNEYRNWDTTLEFLNRWNISTTIISRDDNHLYFSAQVKGNDNNVYVGAVKEPKNRTIFWLSYYKHVLTMNELSEKIGKKLSERKGNGYMYMYANVQNFKLEDFLYVIQHLIFFNDRENTMTAILDNYHDMDVKIRLENDYTMRLRYPVIPIQNWSLQLRITFEKNAAPESCAKCGLPKLIV